MYICFGSIYFQRYIVKKRQSTNLLEYIKHFQNGFGNFIDKIVDLDKDITSHIISYLMNCMFVNQVIHFLDCMEK